MSAGTRVDPARCVAGGMCVMTAPDVFDQAEDGTVVLLRQPGAEQLEVVREAALLCPGQAIDPG